MQGMEPGNGRTQSRHSSTELQTLILHHCFLLNGSQTQELAGKRMQNKENAKQRKVKELMACGEKTEETMHSKTNQRRDSEETTTEDIQAIEGIRNT